MLVIWVEDEEQIGKLVRTCMKKAPVQVSCLMFATGDECMAAIERTHQPFLLVADGILPGEVQGVDICRRAKEKQDSYVVLTSGMPEEMIDTTCCDEFLQKPWGCSHVHAVIFRAMLALGIPR